MGKSFYTYVSLTLVPAYLRAEIDQLCGLSWNRTSGVARASPPSDIPNYGLITAFEWKMNAALTPCVRLINISTVD